MGNRNTSIRSNKQTNGAQAVVKRDPMGEYLQYTEYGYAVLGQKALLQLMGKCLHMFM